MTKPQSQHQPQQQSQFEEDPNKKIVKFEDTPVLQDLGFEEMLQEYNDINAKYKKALKKEKEYDSERKGVQAGILSAIESAGADIVIYTDERGQKYRSSIVRPQPRKGIDVDKLQLACMKIGKLDANQVARIINAATIETKTPAPYVLITLSEEVK